MNKLQSIIALMVLPLSVAAVCSCSGTGRQSELAKYSDLYVHYCRKGLFDSLSMEAGRVFAARNDGMDRQLVLLSGLHSAQAAIFLDNYPEAAAYLDTLSGFDCWEDYPNLNAMFNGIRASYEIKAGFDYPAALAHLTNALNWFREEGNVLNTCNALHNISMIYFYRRDTTGLKYARQAMEISSENPDDPYMMCSAEVVMAMLLLVKGDYEEAEKYAMNAKQIADREQYALVDSRIYMVLGEAARRRGEMDRAEELLQKGFTAARNTDPDFYFELALPYGRMLIQSERYREAEDFLTGVLSAVNKNDNVRYRYVILELLSALYEAQGNITEAYRYYKSASLSRDSIVNIDKEASFNNLLDLYEQASLQNLVRKRQNDMYVTVFICILSILTCAFFFYRYVRQRRLNKELVQCNQEYIKRSDMLRKYLRPESAQAGHEPADEALFGRLERIMREEHAYRSNDISLDKLASMLGTNRTYISRVINRYADKSFWGYVNMYRIAEATEILSNLDNDIQIKNIYENLGYNSAASFFRVFREETGISPSRYREEVRRMRIKA
ncbi:MAG TPA: helix-turn-helix domain-containing protein [Candidatus Coprenecus pullistercoris]|nr:helix-turn-helix domain-containing protein [Candidatus Coprenecus pullistercoris]